MAITVNSRLTDLDGMPAFQAIRGSLIHGWEKEFRGERGRRTLADLQKEHPTWNADDMVYGLRNLERAAEKEYYYPISDKSNMIHLPARRRSRDTWFLLCAGGAYGSVCTMVESLPVAARLNEMGFDCFCLNYHVADEGSFRNGLLPGALADVASAIRMVREGRGQFGLDQDNYCISGFSAGGHLAAVFSEEHVLQELSSPVPRGLLLVYPLISPKTFEPGPFKDYFRTGLFGQLDTDRKEAYYEVADHVTSSYPPTCYVYCEDDDTIPKNNVRIMEESLRRCHVRNKTLCYAKGGHGFGLGSVLPGSDYIEEAAVFLLGEEKSVERRNQ